MNLLVYLITFLLVYISYALIVFGPFILLFVLLEPVALEFLFMLDTAICIVAIPVLALLFWFTHQTTKRIAYERLSLTKSYKDTFRHFKSRLRDPGR